MARNTGSLYKQPGSTVWHCCYYLNGKRFRQSTKEVDAKKAQAFLDGKLAEVDAHKLGARQLITPAVQRLTVGDLLAKLEQKYKDHEQNSAQNLCHIRKATDYFGAYSAIGLDASVFDEYKRAELAKKSKKGGRIKLASVQRVLQMVRAAYNRAKKHDRFPAHEIPFIEIMKENNVRKDCYTEAEFRLLQKQLRPYLRDFALFAARTGMRFSEIASLRWENVKGDVIELAGADAKGDGSDQNARFIPMVGRDLSAILERRTAARRMKRDGTTVLAEYVFHHNGNKIVDIRKNWKSAIRKAGLRYLVFHTLRHTAVRMMDDAGLSRDVAMSLSGHRTQAMYSRYNFSDVKRKRTALEKIQEFAEVMATKESAQNVVSMQR